MSDLDGTLAAITLEHLNHADGPQRLTVTAEGSTYFCLLYTSPSPRDCT